MTDDPESAIRAFYAQNAPSRLGVAVSGGSDSTALLHLLHAAGLSRLSVVTVDHGLRPEAADEAQFVERMCRHLDVPHITLRWDGWDGTGNLPDRARRTRYATMADWALGQGIEAIALGHTLDDQAETFLMRLAREAGVGGLSAMQARFRRDGMEFHRPVLTVSRAGLRDWLLARGLTWVDDPSNADERFERVRARRALDALSPLGVTADGLATVADQLQAADDALARTVSDWAMAHAREDAGDLLIDRAELLALPRELSRRLLAGAVRWMSGAEYPPRRDSLSGALMAVRVGSTATLGGTILSGADAICRVAREPSAVETLSTPTTALWDGRWRMDGPHGPDLSIRPLGGALRQTPWRDTGRARASLMASPAIWRGDEMVAAPLAGRPNGWIATANGRDTFARFLLSR